MLLIVKPWSLLNIFILLIWSASLTCLMKVITASSKPCNKVCELFEQCMSEYQAGVVSDIVCTLLFCSILLQCLHVLQKSGSHITPLCIVNKLDYSLSVSYRGSSLALYAWKRCYEIKPLQMVIMKLCAHSKIVLTIISVANTGRQTGAV